MEPNNLILKMPELTKGIYFRFFFLSFEACAQYQYERIYDVKKRVIESVSPQLFVKFNLARKQKRFH